jgi:hypothetical protein
MRGRRTATHMSRHDHRQSFIRSISPPLQSEKALQLLMMPTESRIHDIYTRTNKEYTRTVCCKSCISTNSLLVHMPQASGKFPVKSMDSEFDTQMDIMVAKSSIQNNAVGRVTDWREVAWELCHKERVPREWPGILASATTCASALDMHAPERTQWREPR